MAWNTSLLGGKRRIHRRAQAQVHHEVMLAGAAQNVGDVRCFDRTAVDEDADGVHAELLDARQVGLRNLGVVGAVLEVHLELVSIGGGAATRGHIVHAKGAVGLAAEHEIVFVCFEEHGIPAGAVEADFLLEEVHQLAAPVKLGAKVPCLVLPATKGN